MSRGINHSLPVKPIFIGFSEKVLEEGLEPPWIAPPDPKSGASANFATRAWKIYSVSLLLLIALPCGCATDCATPTQCDSTKAVNHGGRFLPALDSRKRKVRGLWIRNGRYYAQMRVDQGNGKTRPVRISLKATTLDAAKEEMEEKRTERCKGTIHRPGHRPKFETLVTSYRQSAEFLAKKPGTQENEKQALKRWIAHLGGIRIDWIKTSHMTVFRNQRKAGGVTSRTINLDLVAFNNAMSYAVTAGWLTTPPRLKKLEEDSAPKRTLLTSSNIKKLLDACNLNVTRNAELLRYFMRFLILSGAREQESLQIRKADVDLVGRKVTIGASGNTKNREFRTVDMTDELFDLLHELIAFLPPDISYLFPSPQRGTKDIPASSLRESFYLVRKTAGLEWVGFHDFRHFFCSTCVMAGIDFMTIASWVGHKDGGILIGKVYGHLADEHKRRAAKGLSILTTPMS